MEPAVSGHEKAGVEVARRVPRYAKSVLTVAAPVSLAASPIAGRVRTAPPDSVAFNVPLAIFSVSWWLSHLNK